MPQDEYRSMLGHSSRTAMTPHHFFLPQLSLMILFAGCANPTFTQTKADFTPRNWRTVAILPFAGDARFTSTATDTFSAPLLNLGSLRLIQPSEAEVIIRKLGIVATPSGFTVLEAQRVATEVDADAVIIGVVTSYNNGATLNGFCTAKLIDSRSGEIVAVSHHPSGLLFGYSEHQAVVAATTRTSKEIAKVLSDLARKNHITPPKIEKTKPQTTI
jgi:hypothetical protein